jgi:hypothetical protein
VSLPKFLLLIAGSKNDPSYRVEYFYKKSVHLQFNIRIIQNLKLGGYYEIIFFFFVKYILLSASLTTFLISLILPDAYPNE